MKKLLPVMIALVGMLGGGGAGYFLRLPSGEVTESPEEGEEHGSEAPASEHPEEGAPVLVVESATAEEGSEEEAATEHVASESGNGEAPVSEFEYVKIPQQFVVPVVNETKVSSLVVISLSLEITPGMNEAVFAREPKLRDVFLQAMFIHAHSGGFDGAFTTGQAMKDLRESLKQAAVGVLGDIVNDVLVTDIVRQDT